MFKYASLSVIDAQVARFGAGLMKDAHRHEFHYTPRPGFLYVRSRAISSRCNDNFDEFPSSEIRKSWRTFIGKPVFVNHHNDNPNRARGVIVDAALHEDTNPDGSDDVWVETLHEIDARKFPKLCQAILAGESDRTSMGTNVEYSLCSFCGNKAFTPLDYCHHIPRMKGQRIYRRNASTGEREGVLVREICYGLSFFENSHLVEDPADPTAYLLGIDTRGLDMTASRMDRVGERGEGSRSRSVRSSDGFVWSGDASDLSRIADAGMQRTASLIKTAVHVFISADQKYRKPHGGSFANERYWVLRWNYSPDPADWGGPIELGTEWDSEEANAKLEVAGVSVTSEWEFLQLNGIYRAQGEWDREKTGAKDNSLPPGWRVEMLGLINAVKFTGPGHSLLWSDGVWTMDGTGRTAPGVGAASTQAEARAAGAAFLREVFSEASKTALPGDKIIVPPKVDTLRDDTCPVCGEKDSYVGSDECAVCGFHRPPEQFLDPDTERAKQEDLRQENEESAEDEMADQPGQMLDHFVPLGEEEDPNAPSDVGTDEVPAEEDAAVPDDPNAPAPGAPADEDDEDDDEEEDDPNKPDFLKKKKDKKKSATPPKQSHLEGEDVEMRPTLAAAAEQQIILENQQAQIDAIAQLAGLDLSGVKSKAAPRLAALRKHADENNPAQPIPDPAAEAPAQTTEEALAPDGKDDPTAIGASPVTDVSADAVTDVSGTATVLNEPLDLNEEDPTKPVAGTEEVRPLDEVRTETEVRAGTPADTSPAFPLQGDFATRPTLGAASEPRQFAALRLARLRITAGIESGEDLALATTIVGGDMPDEAIASEIETLSKVVNAQAARAPSQAAPRGLVPRMAAGVERTVPSMAPAHDPSADVLETNIMAVDEAEMLFE